MTHIGTYDGYNVYEIEGREEIPGDTGCLYVKKMDGGIYFGGVRIGRLDPYTYKVKSYDMGIYKSYKKAQETRKKSTKEETSIPTCVAETAQTDSTGAPIGTDLFFARVTKEIDDMLKSAGKFDGDMHFD